MRIAVLATLATLVGATASVAGSLHQVDANGDGGVSYAEFKKVYGPEDGLVRFNYIDRDDNGLIDFDEFNREINND